MKGKVLWAVLALVVVGVVALLWPGNFLLKKQKHPELVGQLFEGKRLYEKTTDSGVYRDLVSLPGTDQSESCFGTENASGDLRWEDTEVSNLSGCCIKDAKGEAIKVILAKENYSLYIRTSQTFDHLFEINYKSPSKQAFLQGCEFEESPNQDIISSGTPFKVSLSCTPPDATFSFTCDEIKDQSQLSSEDFFGE